MGPENISYQDKLTQLRLDISHPNNKSRGINFVFVEGDSDIRLFRKFFRADNCKVEHIPGGNVKLEDCVAELISIYPLIIGVRDADFHHLSPTPYAKPNMFLTDYHDIEMTMLAEDTVLNALIFEFTDIPKTDHITFRNKIIKTIEKISYLKWLNDRENLELKFKKVGFQHLISNFNIDFSQYLSRVLSNSDNATLRDEVIILQKISDLATLNLDLLQLTNGHDTLQAFSQVFREQGNKGVSDKDIARSFRMTYTIAHFQKTNLYEALNNWANQNNTALFIQEIS